MFFQNSIQKWVWCALMLALLTFMFSGMNADADRSIGLSVNQIGPDVSWGASADIPFEMGAAQCDLEATVQGGDQILGKSALEVSVPVAGFDAGLFTKTNVKGYSVSDLGRATDIGAKFGRTFGDVQVSLGIFGRNGGVFSQPNALKTLEDNGYDIAALEGLGLESVDAAPTGLSIKAGNAVNALIEAEFDLDFAHVRIQGMPELSASEDAVHQLITTLQSSWNLRDNLQLTGTLDVGFQTFGGELEREIANLWQLSCKF